MDMKHAFAAAALLALAGCGTTPGWEAQLGDTVRQAQTAQLIDPAASSRAPRPEGLDGKAVAGSLRDYASGYGYVERAARPEARTQVNPR